MKIRKIILTLLVFGLTMTKVSAQFSTGQTARVSLNIITTDSMNFINPTFIFPTLSENELSEIAEIYIEFSLSGKISKGTYWPAFSLGSDCLRHGDEHFYVGRINTMVSSLAATHFVRISDPINFLVKDPVMDAYTFELFEGFCRLPPLEEMIGYVDIILHASNSWHDGDPNSVFLDYCADIDMSLKKISLLTSNSGVHDILDLGWIDEAYGPNCGNRMSSGMLRTKEETSLGLDTENSIKVYPNPTTTDLFIEHPTFTDHTTLSLYALDGRLLKNEKVKHQKTKWSVQDLEAGLYYLRIKTGQQIIIHKVMIGK